MELTERDMNFKRRPMAAGFQRPAGSGAGGGPGKGRGRESKDEGPPRRVNFRMKDEG